MSYYVGNQTGNEPGLLPQPYFWWEAGALWGGMVEYWHYTGDASYNGVVSQAILAQASPTNDFMMPEEAGQLVSISNSPQGYISIDATRVTTTKSSGPSPP